MLLATIKQKIMSWIQERGFFVAFILFFVVLFLFFIEKSTAVTYWYHLDPWFNKPIGEFLESGIDWEKHIMYPGLGLRLFYVGVAGIKVVTGMTYFQITQFGFILISLLQVVLLGLVIRSFYKKKIVSGMIIIVLLLCLANPFVVRRLSMTVRENLAIIGYLGFLLVFIRYKFSKIFPLSVFSGLVYGSNPITSFFLFFSNLGYGIMLLLTKNYGEIRSWAKQFGLGLIFGSYFFLMFIDSLIWQYQYVEEKVVAKNPFAYSYYYIDDTQITILFIVFAVVSIVLFYKKYAQSLGDFFKKKTHVYTYMFVVLTMMLVIFFASYSPKVGLYQDRLVMYIVIFSAIVMMYFIRKNIRYRIILLLLASLSLVQITKNASHIYYSPFDNTNFTLAWYQDISNYKGKILAYNFDENILFNINHTLRIDGDGSLLFKQIDTFEKFNSFNKSNEYLLFISKDTMKEMQQIFPIKELLISGKMSKLEDGNYLYINHP
ncbi:hypothetical protein HOO68_05675 [Candidatus Gracilibacteria bacterium]|nr:hypothetical protein [Candidatus Gracilibacteria bacterium]